jgi:hypothetical protein
LEAEVQGEPEQIFVRPHLQNTQAKWTGGVAQAVKRLVCKHKVLSSNCNTAKKQIKTKNLNTTQNKKMIEKKEK